MIGYYPPPQNGELIYSSTAAAVSLSRCGALERERLRLLGSLSRSFGGLFPNHCRALQANVPDIAGLTDARIIDGSGYHVFAPFLLEEERNRLLKSMFHGCAGRERSRTNKKAPLRFCRECIREDIDFGRRMCWRVDANIPGSNTCAKHGFRFIETAARFADPHSLHHAPDWIDAAVRPSSPGSQLEKDVACDFRWLLTQKSAMQPGWDRIALALGNHLSHELKYRRTNHFLNIDHIVSDLARYSATVEGLAPWLLRPSRLSTILYKNQPAHVVEYLVLIRFAGIDLQSLFLRACDPMIATTPYAESLSYHRTYRNGSSAIRLAVSKARIERAIANTPNITRSQLHFICGDDPRLVKKIDPRWFAEHLPLPKGGFRDALGWQVKDRYFQRRIREALQTRHSRLHRGHIGKKTILDLAGIHCRALDVAAGRLPGTAKLVEDAIRQFRRVTKIRGLTVLGEIRIPDARKDRREEQISA